MGWCSATEYVDATVRAADELLASIGTGSMTPAQVDGVLRPFVRAIAAPFRDGDWDCVAESDYYDRFGPELEGQTEVQFYLDQVNVYAESLDPEGFVEWRERWIAAGREVPATTTREE